jgi:O-antigen ligase
MFFPVVVGFLFFPGIKTSTRYFTFFIFIILVFGLIFSYGRAAWLSVVAAFVVFLLIILRIRFSWIAIASIALISLFFAFQQQVLDRLEKNKQDSSANFVEHIQSMSNISSDASNLERINRWQAALRLFDERPIVGWGPGTYQFVYAPFQRSKEKTIISTNLGDLGNAHSEYLGPLSEMGLPGMLIVFLLVIYVVYYGTKVYTNTRGEIRFLGMMALLGLVTYFTHGLLNNFLDSDKLSVPFWGFIAIIVAIDIYHSQKPEKVSAGE